MQAESAVKSSAVPLEAVWAIGSAGQSPSRVRQIASSNQVAVLASAATAPYQAFYVIYDAGYYAGVMAVNLVFMACYLATLPLNRAGRFDAASKLSLATSYVHLFVVTVLIGTGTGVYFFYFAIGASLVVLFVPQRERLVLGLILLAVALFVTCHFAFPPAKAVLDIPAGVADVMFAASAAGAVGLTAMFPYLFRLELDRAEAALLDSNAELERLSGVDPLTGVANRRTLDVRLAHEWGRLRREGRPLSVLLCDVDCFKAYNDHYGHQAGDACLQGVAGALGQAVNRSADLVARYGGEEFVIVLPATDDAGADRVAEDARALVEGLGIPHEHSSVAPLVTVSVGVACADAATLEDPGELLRRADTALYAAKRDGRNRVRQWAGPPAAPA